MKIEAARFVTDFRRKNKPRWISLLGTSGSGKTMLAKMIGSLCFRGWIDKWGEIVRLLRDGEHRRFYDLSNEEFLVIDDICAEYETDFIKAKMYEFLSLRENRWTVLTANLSIQQIGERFDPRIASRMIRHGSAVVDVDVMDFNLRRSIPQTFDDVRKIMKGDQ